MKTVISIRAYMRTHESATVAEVAAAIHKQHKTAARIMRQMLDSGELVVVGQRHKAIVYRAGNPADEQPRALREPRPTRKITADGFELQPTIPGARVVPARHTQSIQRSIEWLRPAGAAC